MVRSLRNPAVGEIAVLRSRCSLERRERPRGDVHISLGEGPDAARMKRRLQINDQVNMEVPSAMSGNVDSFSQFLNWSTGNGFYRTLGREHPINLERREQSRERRRR